MLTKEQIDELRRVTKLIVPPDIQAKLKPHEVIKTELDFATLSSVKFLHLCDHSEALLIAVEAIEYYFNNHFVLRLTEPEKRMEEALTQIANLVGERKLVGDSSLTVAEDASLTFGDE